MVGVIRTLDRLFRTGGDYRTRSPLALYRSVWTARDAMDLTEVLSRIPENVKESKRVLLELVGVYDKRYVLSFEAGALDVACRGLDIYSLQTCNFTHPLAEVSHLFLYVVPPGPYLFASRDSAMPGR